MRRSRVALLVLAALAGGCSSPTAPPPLPPLPAPAASPTPTPAPTPVPSPPAPVDSPPNLVLRVKPEPPEGDAPLLVSFNLCRSVEPDGEAMLFAFDFGDGTSDQGPCREDHVYSEPGRYHPSLCVWDHRPGHVVCQQRLVIARTPPPPEDQEE